MKTLISLLMLTSAAQADTLIVGTGPAPLAIPMPKCESGWTIVMDAKRQLWCARELRAPQ